MKGKFQTLIVLIALCWLSLIALSGAKQTPSESYYERLKSLVAQPRDFPIRPNATGRDVNVIEVEKGAAGVVFGASMDDVIAVWGKPSVVMIDGIREAWYLGIGTCLFGFTDDRLTSIRVHPLTLEKAHLANGIGFGSSRDEVESAFSGLIKLTDSRYRFVTEDGYTIDFRFSSDESASDQGTLDAIEISSPDSGRSERSRPGRRRTRP